MSAETKEREIHHFTHGSLVSSISFLSSQCQHKQKREKFITLFMVHW